ncbi:Hypothetical predicted protein [Mytilus galloprovincialis]|uniref:Uncharacterized protein n=1 Tax=Mytilus galloprovincialis TaxID=29158 RepID=A0A8B6DE06_MYTGA|nr:Hypothetical predicted protein [Mytilus galloprovincialis]
MYKSRLRPVKEEKWVRGFRVCKRVSETILRCGRGLRCITMHHTTTIVICQSPSTVVRVGSGAGIGINGCKVDAEEESTEEVLVKKIAEEESTEEVLVKKIEEEESTEEVLVKKIAEESTEEEAQKQEEATFAFRWSVATPPPCEEKETILGMLIIKKE